MFETNEQAWQEIEFQPAEVRETYHQLPRVPIELIACPLGKAVNHGGLLRVAEAFRIENVCFSPEADSAEDFAGHRGAGKWQPFEWIPLDESIPRTRRIESKRHLVAVTIDDRAQSFSDWKPQFPLSIVVGSEWYGVPEWVVAEADDLIAIPMYGMMGSLNVATATAIVLQHYASLYAQQHSIEPIRAESRSLLKLDD